jgi:hypothetical protein
MHACIGGKLPSDSSIASWLVLLAAAAADLSSYLDRAWPASGDHIPMCYMLLAAPARACHNMYVQLAA